MQALKSEGWSCASLFWKEGEKRFAEDLKALRKAQKVLFW